MQLSRSRQPAPAITAVRFIDCSKEFASFVRGAPPMSIVPWDMSNYGHMPRTLLSVGSVWRHSLISFL